jgi:hypothetical protein
MLYMVLELRDSRIRVAYSPGMGSVHSIKINVPRIYPSPSWFGGFAIALYTKDIAVHVANIGIFTACLTWTSMDTSVVFSLKVGGILWFYFLVLISI